MTKYIVSRHYQGRRIATIKIGARHRDSLMNKIIRSGLGYETITIEHIDGSIETMTPLDFQLL